MLNFNKEEREKINQYLIKFFPLTSKRSLSDFFFILNVHPKHTFWKKNIKKMRGRKTRIIPDFLNLDTFLFKKTILFNNNVLTFQVPSPKIGHFWPLLNVRN